MADVAPNEDNDALRALIDEISEDRRLVTVSFVISEGRMEITHDGMNAYEALGLLTTATDLIRNDLCMYPADEEEDDDEDDA